MSGARTVALAQRLLRQFRRDHRTVALLFVVPIMLLSLLSYVVRQPPGRVDIGVAEPGHPLAPALLAALRAGGATAEELNWDAAVRAVGEGRLDGAVRLPVVPPAAGSPARPAGPPGVSGAGLAAIPLEVEILVEGSDPQASAAVVAAIGRALPQAAGQLVTGGGPPVPPVRLIPRYLHGGPEFDALDYFAPAFLGLFVFFFVYLLTAVSFLRERMQGSIERLLVSPLRRAEVIVGYMLGFGLFAALQSAVVLLFSVLVLRLHYAGSLALIFAVTLLLMAGAVNLGIFLSTFARTELQVVQFIPLVIAPQVLLSGIMWPVNSMPAGLQLVAQALPLTHAVQALRDVMVKGAGPLDIWPQATILLVFSAVMVVLASRTLQREVA